MPLLSPGSTPTSPPPADMVKDVIREYEGHFPEIIERATFTLEKVGAGTEAALLLWRSSGMACSPGGPVPPCLLWGPLLTLYLPPQGDTSPSQALL